MGVTRQDVVDCYRYILCREPENDRVIQENMGYYDRLAICKGFYASREWRDRHPGVVTDSRMHQNGEIETLGIFFNPPICKEGMEKESLIDYYHKAKREGFDYFFIVDEIGRFMHKVVDRNSLFANRGESEYLSPMHQCVEVGKDDSWQKNVFKIWDTWKRSCPGWKFAPVTRQGILIAVISPWGDGRGPWEGGENLDIDWELFKLIQKYNIYRDEPDLLAYSYDIYTEKLLNQMIEALPSDGKIALLGCNSDSLSIYNRLSKENRLKLDYVIDEDEKEFKVLTSVKESSIAKCHINIIILSSYSSRELFKKRIYDSGKDIRLVDPYDYLKQNGIVYGGALPPRDKDYRAVNYLEINNALKAYTDCPSLQKAFYLRRLIAYCVDIKNFVYAEKYIRLYVERKYEDSEKYLAFQRGVEKLVEEIKRCIRKRHQEDIIVDWVDATCAEEFYNTNFVKSIENKALIFTKAYTNTPWTNYTYRNIFLGRLPISGKTYLPVKFDPSSSYMLKKLQDSGYIFKYIANPGLYQKNFPSGSSVHYGNGKIAFNLAFGRGTSECSSRLQWMALGQRLKDEHPLCLWIHDLSEVHDPFGYIGRKGQNSRLEYHKEGLKILEEQLSWYAQFRSDYQHNIYMNDHGLHEGIAAQKFYGDKAAHIGMIVHSYKAKAGKISKLYSHINFSKVVDILLSAEKEADFTKACSKYVIGENPDYTKLDEIMININRRLIQLRYYQQVYVRTEEDLYVRYTLLNKELYFRYEDENTNLINDPQWQDRIDYLRSLAPKAYIDIEKESAFKESKRLYDFIKTFSPEEIPW